MAKFCGNCGSELVKNKCPQCDSKKEVVVKEVTQNETTNGLAITGFVLSLVSLLFGVIFSIAGLICSIIGLNQINKTNEQGKGLATAGIIISAIMTFIYIVIIVFFVLLMLGLIESEL